MTTIMALLPWKYSGITEHHERQTFERNEKGEISRQNVSRKENDFVDEMTEGDIVVHDFRDVVTHFLEDQRRQESATELCMAGKVSRFVGASRRVDANVEKLLRVAHPCTHLNEKQFSKHEFLDLVHW